MASEGDVPFVAAFTMEQFSSAAKTEPAGLPWMETPACFERSNVQFTQRMIPLGGAAWWRPTPRSSHRPEELPTERQFSKVTETSPEEEFSCPR